MCGGKPSMPKPQPMPPPAPPAPPPPPMPEPAAPLPPPVAASAGEGDAAKVQKRTSKRAALQQASTGTAALRNPLDIPVANVPSSGGSGSAPAKKGNLNIPK